MAQYLNISGSNTPDTFSSNPVLQCNSEDLAEFYFKPVDVTLVEYRGEEAVATLYLANGRQIFVSGANALRLLQKLGRVYEYGTQPIETR